MALKDVQGKIGALNTESQNLAMKAELSDADLSRIEEISVEGTRLQREMDALKRAGEFGEFATRSAGMLPLAAVTVHGMVKSGETVIERKGDSVLINSEGEGILGDRMTETLRSREYSDSFRTYLRKGRGHIKSESGLKVLQEGLDDQGGYLVPEDIQNRILSKSPAPTVLASRLQRFTTSRDTVIIPKVVYSTANQYTTGMRVTWGGEVPASATSHRVTEPVFGNLRVPIFTAMMSLPLTNDLIEDSAFDVIGFCSDKFNETINLLRENMALNGTGVGQPRGMLANPDATDEPAEVHSGVAAGISWEGIQDLVWALPEQYDANAAICFNKTSTGLAVSKLVDGDGRPLWTQGVQDSGMVGSPKQRQLMGYPVIYSAFMPDIAASAHAMVFGDFSGYVVVDRVGFSMQVLRELYAETNQVVLLGRVRFGGAVAEDWKLKVLSIEA